MDLEVVSKEDDTMKIKVISPNVGEVTSKAFSLSGVDIQFRRIILKDSRSNFLCLRITQTCVDESIVYICTVNTGKNSNHHCNADQCWRIIYEGYNHEINVTVTIKVNIVSLQSPFSVLYEDTELTDFELRGEDGSSVQVHSFVLAASSPVLRAMLGKQCKETKDRSYYIKDATQTTLQHLKDFMYTNAIPETGVEELLQLSHCYMMPELEKSCTKRLLDNMNADNVMSLTKFANQHGFQKLNLAILRRIQSQPEQVNLENVKLL